jgi:recombinational DNA repair ATPase RecF
MEEDNASLREYVLVLETRVARLQSVAPTESTMIRIRDDANANYANLGQRIISIRTQCINALHELDNKYQLKCDELTANLSNLTRRLDAAIEDGDLNKTKLNARLDGLIADYLYFIQ